MKKFGERATFRRRGALGEEDIALWHDLARTFEPLRGAKPRVRGGAPSGAGDEAGAANSAPARPLLKPPTRARDPVARPMMEPRQQGPEAGRGAPPLAEFERRHARRLRSGQVEIEARLDLHGMRQSDAHAALRRFLLACHARGVRWALVITGKGAAMGGLSSGHERGVLRRNVPRWLAEPELRAIVVSYTAAGAPHGGEGALYVQIRRRRGEE